MITLKNLSKSYQYSSRKTIILEQLELNIKKGKWTTIVGPSGSGKSTLLHCMSGLLKPDTGSVIFEDTDLYQLSEKDRNNFRRKKIGFVFQDFKLLPYYSVIDNVILPLLFDYSKRDLILKAKHLLQNVGITDEFYYRLPDGLSGGEKQRVAIARSLIGRPDVLICDEPTGNLDIENRDRIIQLLLELRSKGQTIIIVTHDTEVAACGDVTYQLHHGQVRDGLVIS